MKTRFQTNKLSMTCEPSKGTLGRLVTAIMFWAGALLVFNLGNRSAAAGENDACQESAQHAFGSCREVAESDYRLDLGKCENVSYSVEEEQCEKQAAAHFKKALQLCKTKKCPSPSSLQPTRRSAV